MSGRPPHVTGPSGTTPPRKAHRACSQPLEKFHRPDTRYPPSTTSILPVGAYDEEISVVGSSPHTSCCVSGANIASCQLCTLRIEVAHAVDAHAPPMRLIAS